MKESTDKYLQLFVKKIFFIIRKYIKDGFLPFVFQSRGCVIMAASASLAPQEAVSIVREISKMSKQAPHSLVHLSLVAYLKFLEEECASYVLLTTLNSTLWNPVKEKLFNTLKHHLNSTFKG